MPGQINITFKDFTYLDLSTAQRVEIPKRKVPVAGQETLLRGALQGIAAVSPHRRARITSLLDLVTPPPASMTVSGTVPGATIRSGFPDFTVTFGAVASGGQIAAFGVGGGVYFWNKTPHGEIGLYGSISVGMVTNLGMGVGDQIAWLFGPADKVLAGDSITIQVDIGIDLLTVSGVAILSAPSLAGWPPVATPAWKPEIIGIGVALTMGLSALPVDISVMPGRTWIKPLTP